MSARHAFHSLLLLPILISGAGAAEATASAPIVVPAPRRMEAEDTTSLRAKADRGNAIAQYNLGLAYLQQRDLIEAFVWLTIAADNGSTGKALENILPQLTPAQLEEGRRRLQMLRTANPKLGRTVEAKPLITRADPPMVTPTPRAVNASDTANTEIHQLRQQLATMTKDQRQLSSELAAAWKETQRLETELARRRSGTPELAALQKNLETAQAAAATQARELAARTAEAAAARSELASARSELAQTKSKLDDLSASQARTATDTTNRLVDDLRQQLTRTQTQLREAREGAEKTTAATTQHAQEVSAVRSELQAERTRAAALESERNRLATEFKNAATHQDQALQKLTDENRGLTERIAKLDTDLARSQAAAQAGARTSTEAQTRLTALTEELAGTRQELAAAMSAVAELATQKVSAGNAAHARDEAQRRVAAITGERDALQARLTQATSTANAAADSAAQAEELTKKLTADNESLRQRLTQAESEMRMIRDTARGNTDQQRAELTHLQRSLSETQLQLQAAHQELTTYKSEIEAARALGPQLRQLEAEKAALTARLNAAEAVRTATASTPTAGQTDAEQRLPVVLRSFTLVSRERDELRAELNALAAKLAASTETIARLESEARATAARHGVASAPAESDLAPAQAEQVRALSPAANTGVSPVEFAPANSLPGEAPAAPAEPTTVSRPVVATTASGVATFAPRRPSAGNGVPTTSAAAPPVTLPRTHMVVSGDTLSSIARQYYGTPTRWPDILAANRDTLRSERDLVAGRILRIP